MVGLLNHLYLTESSFDNLAAYEAQTPGFGSFRLSQAIISVKADEAVFNWKSPVIGYEFRLSDSQDVDLPLLLGIEKAITAE